MAIATLSIDIEARMANLQASMDRAAQISEQRAKQVADAWKKAGVAVGVATAAAAAGTALIAMVRNVADTGDAMSKMAQRTSATVEELSRLQYAAGLSDVSTESLQGALVKLNRVMGDAADGSKEATAALARFGISPQEGLSTTEAFARIAEAVKNTGDEQRIASGLNDVFGRSFADLLPMLREGEGGLAALGDEAQRLGVVMSTELARASAQFNDNLDRFKAMGEGAAISIGGKLLPVLVDTTDAVLKLDSGTHGAASALGEGLLVALQTVVVMGANTSYVLTQIGKEIGGIGAQAAAVARLDFSGAAEIGRMMKEDAEAARIAIDAFSERVLGAGKATEQVFGGRSRADASAYAREVGGIADAAGKVGAKAKEAKDALGDLIRRAMERDADRTDALRQRIESLADPLKQYKDQLAEIEAAVSSGAVSPEVGAAAIVKVYEDIDRTLESANPRMRELADNASRLQQIMASTESGQIAAMAADVELLQQAMENGTLTAEQYAEAVQAISGQTKKLGDDGKSGLEKFTEQFAKQQDESRQWAAVMNNAFDTTSDAITEFVMTGKGSFSEFAKSIIADITKIIVKQMLLKAVMSAANSFGYKDGGAFDGGVQAFAKGGTFTNSIVTSPTLFKFAKGTGLMGEAGPEAIMPLSRGADGSLGVRALAPVGSGSNVTVLVVESPGRGGEVERQQTDQGEQITVLVDRIKGEVAGDIRSGRGVVPEAMQSTYGLSRAYAGAR